MSAPTPGQPVLFTPLEVVSTSKLLSMQQDQCRLYMTRCYHSAGCRLFYVSLVVINLVCIGWTLYKFGAFPRDLWFLALEVFLSSMILSEVVWRWYLHGWKFFASASNLCDVGISLACIAALALAVLDSGLFPEVEGVSGDVLLVFRTGVQYLRLVLFLKNQKKAHMAALHMIDFSELAEAGGDVGAPSSLHKKNVTEEERPPNSSVADLNSNRKALFHPAEDATDEDRGKTVSLAQV